MARRCPDRLFFQYVKWSPVHKVVIDHRTGFVFVETTDDERRRRGLPVPWHPELMASEMLKPPFP